MASWSAERASYLPNHREATRSITTTSTATVAVIHSTSSQSSIGGTVRRGLRGSMEPANRREQGPASLNRLTTRNGQGRNPLSPGPLNPVCLAEARRSRTLIFIYHIVPQGGTAGQALVVGHLIVSSSETAKSYVQIVTAPQLVGKSDLEIILQDIRGVEIWRGPYLGNGSSSAD